VTSGGLDAIERALRDHARTGDRIAVEDPASPALLDLLGSLGLIPAPVSNDGEGVEPGSLERALGGVRAVVLSPRAQNPTGAAFSARRVAELSRVLRPHPETLVIEVDEASAVSGAEALTVSRGRRQWLVVRSTSRFLGPDLRVAVATGDDMTIERVRRRQAVGERWVSHILQGLAVALWADPSSGRHLARVADVYAERRCALVAALAAHDIAASPRSGFHVWVPVREEAATVQNLADRGWAVAAGERFRLRSAPAIRITTSALTPDDALRLAADLAASVRPSAAAPA
jgi:DNA-binding transcriptional MocR family regulator